ncbi:MAG: bis(5'-nucleosyl)-tetraphosphatase (symmetrical) YqeK [Candidatus Eremiobacteraeota bacterium]|nr:bis(5'-nucleosyl)-tetraphosphatase (symmetrical) YqeK [Candidatus Eremiobacteraeota bacterium]MBV9055340.1 bis(5'-nucleosyl)-tetraphosphatase (symmetrical) YqeK [Candidatus Eremiobacteraeota bacterium]MBV9701020.1 bis(5'-nucleosyl)-tetraphosphatase (symmetrical) YqeK [Candidatus Eremiobacteraeota bacterium]
MTAVRSLEFVEMARLVRAALGQENRYAHSVRVARYAGLLARRHGLDRGKARTAGLLHDLARLYPKARLLDECEARRLPIAPYERAHPVLLHAKLGAALAREEFGVTDGDVLSAIEKHTTAAPVMSPLDCIVYLADALEPAREFAERPRLWRLALRDLRAAMREVLFLTMQHYARKGVPAAPPTLEAAAAFGVAAPGAATKEACASN